MKRARILFFSASLSNKMIMAFLAVVILSVAPLVILYSRTTRAALTGKANQALFAAASRTAASLDGFIDTNLNAVRTEATLPSVVQYLSLRDAQRLHSVQESKAMATLLALRNKDRFSISSYALLDRHGWNVLDTVEPDIGLDESGNDYFQIPLWTGLPYISPVEFSRQVGEGYFYFSSPVRNSDGQLVGVLRIRYSVSALQELVSESQRLAGDESFAILLDENYLRLAHDTAPDLIFRTVVPLNSTRVEKLQASGRLPNVMPDELSTNLPTFARGLQNAVSRPFFVADAHGGGTEIDQMAVVKLKNQRWFVVFAQPQSVFMYPIERAIRTTLVWTVIVAGLVVAAAILMGQWLANPIKRLTETAEQIRSGDLTAQADVQSKDEIGELARTFNSMTARLRLTLEGLNRRNQQLSQEIAERVRAEEQREKLILELQDALAKVKTMRGLLPICASCKKIRDDQGYWQQVEVYVRERSEAEFSHGICPDCARELYPELYEGQ